MKQCINRGRSHILNMEMDFFAVAMQFLQTRIANKSSFSLPVCSSPEMHDER